MRKILHITIIIAVSLNLLHAPEGIKNRKKQLRRIYIVRCCGKKSCLSVGKNINAKNNSLFRKPETTAKSWGKTTFFTEVQSAIGNAGMVTDYASAKQEQQVAGETATIDAQDSNSVSTEVANSQIPEASTDPSTVMPTTSTLLPLITKATTLPLLRVNRYAVVLQEFHVCHRDFKADVPFPTGQAG
ncbi:Hypothetical predicted protein [Cloeon dipterum]|uniref:Uncharacterized protein n=1 Tax=Cloeon dipterum TaxID=197152 RepID=A0A8S1CW35_9INSE|nr:Hypothetical predicted protein [Cloeon dipterum]